MSRGRAGPRLLALLLGVLFAAAALEVGLRLLGWALARSERAAEPPAAAGGLTLLCAGDSVTAGLGASAGQSYPRQLQRLLRGRHPDLRPRVQSLGRSGYNSSEVLSSLRASQALARGQAAAVLLLAGGANWWNLRQRDLQAEARAQGLAAALGQRLSTVRLARLLWSGLRHRLRVKDPDAGPPDAPAGGGAAADGEDRCASLITRARARPARPAAAAPDLRRQALARQLRAHPGRGRLYLEMSRALAEQGLRLESLVWLLRGVEADPGEGLLYARLGWVHYRWLWMFDQAERWFLLGVQRAPQSVQIYHELVNFNLHQINRLPTAVRLSRALRWLRRSRPLAPECAPQVDELAALLQEQLAGRDDPGPWIAADLEQAVLLARRRGARVILQTYPSDSRNRPEILRAHRAVARVVAALARRYRLPLVDHQARFAAQVAAGTPEAALYADDVEHPSDRGYGLMAQGLYEALRAQGLLARPPAAAAR